MDSQYQGGAPAQRPMAPAPLFSTAAPQYSSNPQQAPMMAPPYQQRSFPQQPAPQYEAQGRPDNEYPIEKTPFADTEAPQYQQNDSRPPQPFMAPQPTQAYNNNNPAQQLPNSRYRPESPTPSQASSQQSTPSAFRIQGTMSSKYVGGGLRPRTMSQQQSAMQGLAYPPPISLRGPDGPRQAGFQPNGPAMISRAPTWEEPSRNPYRAHSTSASISERKPWVDDEKRQAPAPLGDISDLEKLVEKQEQPQDGRLLTSPPDAPRPKIPLRHRIKHFTWAWYTWTMGTGALALLIIAQPFQFTGLRSIGLAVYIFNLTLFSTITMTMISRFVMFPGTFAKSIRHKKEGFFVATAFVSVSTMISGAHRYLIPENSVALNTFIQVMFWSYVTVSMIATITQYSYIFTTHQYGLQAMMPAWLLPVLPIMLAGTISSVISATQPSMQATSIIVAGLLSQGLGMIISLLIYAHMIGRLMSSTFPDREARPALFILVGPPSFTALAFIGIANNLPSDFDIRLSTTTPILPGQPGVTEKAVIQLMAYVVGTALWGLSLWWFSIALTGVLRAPPRYFHLPWWGMIFPNAGFSLATITLGKSFGNVQIQILGTVMSSLVVLLYLYILYNHIRALLRREIMYPGKDEDTDD
ncbi:hypothetical protein MCOR25_005028 [Pyricularia grisea]|uniref:Malic acid transport protein n=1 Tax=Pyricularia grisea TaxID=148305 RepID=A0A6P8B433_PYRGI|nr:hypothetical protein PgNI_05532 [Pyricularia grisea]KAI6366977.1 hypothetical protein MCOR25_005028 [Pyricularia grisea]TLD10033.1 hypothetical protein PgNI_05532 [Pyricularia grisea]